MKKAIYYLLFFAFSTMAFSACTEEEVTPSTDLESSENSGIGVSDPKGPR